jgi:hypothetical protein
MQSVGEKCLDFFRSIWESTPIPLPDGSTTNLA